MRLFRLAGTPPPGVLVTRQGKSYHMHSCLGMTETMVDRRVSLFLALKATRVRCTR